MRKEDRVKILKDNYELVDELDAKPKFISYDPYIREYISVGDEKYSIENISFEESDTINAVLKHKNLNGVDFLVFASSKHYGGGVWSGSKAQEEDIFLSTDLFSVKNELQRMYPINGILTVDCHVIRSKNLQPLDYGINTRAFFAPAPNMNLENPKPDFYTRMNNLARVTLMHSKGKCLILGAWGCGVFKNDPKEVAQMFKEMMPVFLDVYEKVVFAIPDKRILNIFKEIISK